MLTEVTQTNLKLFESFAAEVVPALYPNEITKKKLLDSVQYSLQGGGKRFRPAITIAVAELIDLEVRQILPWCLALEMIHTYSLIHDDLPCMDNDDFRRGKPTNHKLFGESIALLAGDALLTEAFGVVAKFYSQKNDTLGKLITELTQISGLRGMIGGQFLDMEADTFSLDSVRLMHNLKTGALISGCFSGPGIIKGLTAENLLKLKNIGQEIGFLFQAKDDVLDFNDKNQDLKSIIPLLGGLDATNQYINLKTEELAGAVEKLVSSLGISLKHKDNLISYLKWNQNRTL